MKKTQLSISISILLLGAASASHATIIGFGQLGGNNATVPADFASNAVEAGNGYVVSNGTTPNVALDWGGLWDIHTSGNFADIENQTIGGGDWDNEGGIPRIGQFEQNEANTMSIGFSVDPGFALVLNSFDFGNTAETVNVTNWDVVLTDANNVEIWSQSVEFDNNIGNNVLTLAPNFTGDLGASYTLAFIEIGEHTEDLGRTAIDNLSFSQIPEPSTYALLGGLGALGVALIRRRRNR